MFFAVLNALALAIRLWEDRSVSSRVRAFTGVAGNELSEGWTSSNDSPSISLPEQDSAASILEFALYKSVFWLRSRSHFAITKPLVLHRKSLNLIHSPNWMQARQPP
jgi:hypothetical protein